MKQRLVSILFAVCIVASMVTGAAGVVAGQDGGDNNTTNTTATETETPSDDNDGDEENDRNVTSDDLWKLFKNDRSAEKPESEKIIANLGPNLYVTNLEFNEDSETAEITVVAQVTTRVTITDATAFDREREVSVAESRSMTVPRGTYTLVVPATVRDKDDNQAVTVAPGNGKIYMLSNQMVNSNFLTGVVSLKVALGAIGAFLLGILLRVGYKVYRKQETGVPESLDGTAIESSRVGVMDDE